MWLRGLRTYLKLVLPLQTHSTVTVPPAPHPATPGQGEETTGAAPTPSGRERTVGWAQLPW